MREGSAGGGVGVTVFSSAIGGIRAIVMNSSCGLEFGIMRF